MFVLDGEQYEVDDITIDMWEIYIAVTKREFKTIQDYLEHFREFCGGIINILKTDKKDGK